jgi:preprotein translocase subunit SecG
VFATSEPFLFGVTTIMQQVLIVIHLLVVLALVGVILLQRSDSGALGGLGGGGGVSGFMTGRGQANALTRATGILAACFFATSIALAIVSGATRESRSVIDDAASKLPAQTAPAGGVLDQLKAIDQKAPPASGPQVPTTR